MKLTVSEYAKQFNISVQTVYKKIKRGVITSVKENNMIYVVIDDEEGLNKVKQKVKSNSNELLTLVKTQQKEIKRLTKALEKCSKTKEKVFVQYITELKQLQITYTPKEDQEEIIDLEEPSKKHKKKHKKKKGKKK